MTITQEAPGKPAGHNAEALFPKERVAVGAAFASSSV